MPDQYRCVQCGRAFDRPAARTTPSHCSRGCAAKTAAGVNATKAKAAKLARRPTRICVRCGAPFTVERASAKTRHCSHACYRTGMAGDNHPKHKAKVPRICEYCRADFLAWPFKVRDGGARYCSPRCFHAARKTGISGPSLEQVCAICEQPFRTWPYRVRAGAITCSRACYDAMTRILPRPIDKSRLQGETRTCVICAAPFYFSASRAREGQPGRTCSLKCRGAWQKLQPRKSTSRDSAAYREWRAAVYRRDNYTCQRCGVRSSRKNRLHAHHIKYWADYPELRFEVSNGLLLCGSCHAREHFNVSVLQRRTTT